MTCSRVHVIIHATIELDDDWVDVDHSELYEPLQEAAAQGLDRAPLSGEVISTAVLEVFDAVDPSWGEGP